MIGILASAPFLAQLLQLPAILLVERRRTRKRISVLTSIAGRLMLGVMAVTAFFTGTGALFTFLCAQWILCGLGAVGTCAWNSWLRDLAPESRLGQIFAKRTIWLTAISLALGLAAAFALDLTAEHSHARNLVLASMFAIGCVTGLMSARVVSALHFNVSFVLVLSVVSQVANIGALRYWGLLSDRFANKSVLAVCAPAYIVSIVGMIGASQIGDRDVMKLWLIALHLLMGASVAGVTLTATNIALKLSPRGSATAYVAASATVTAVAAGMAPIIGGLLADFFAKRKLEVLVRWSNPDRSFGLPLALTEWDFYFLIAGLIGLYAVHRLSLVQEQGEIERRELVGRMLDDTRRGIRNISSVAGLRSATAIPVSLLRDARVRLRLRRARSVD